MSDAIIDSSVVVKWILPESDSPQAKSVILDIGLKGERLIVLDLAYPEVANAIWKQFHRGLIPLEETRECVEALLEIPLHKVPAIPLLKPAMEIGTKYHRALYDALFVALVQDMDLPGITADEPLYRAVHADFPKIVLLRNYLP